MYKHIFGPVPSRRLGISLGVDLVPHKVCSLNCVYCECGRTTNLTLERKEYVPFDKVIFEIDDYMNNHPKPDYVTFSGSGEPTLNSRIGDVLSHIKQNYSSVPVALLTNGTLLSDKRVRREILPTDVAMPSLDAVSDRVFRKINRPFSSLAVEDQIRGLIDFRNEYKGEIWLEVFILPGINDDRSELEKIKDAILSIRPERVQLNTLDRPGAVEGLSPASAESLEKIVELWNLDNVEIVASARKRTEVQSFRKDTESAIYETIQRRPCTLDDLIEILGLHRNEINKYLDVLDKKGLIESLRLDRGLFYQSKK